MRRANPPDRPYRRSIRLSGYDYASTGAYFVTIVVQGRACVFGQVVGGEMQRNLLGDLINYAWHDMPHHHPNVVLDAFVVMPNHIHGIILLIDPVGATPASPAPASPAPASPTRSDTDLPAARGPSPGSIGAIIGSFKASTSRRLNILRQGDAGVGAGDAGVAPTGLVLPEGRLWQRNYYEHVIRTDDALNHIRNYIHTNPQRWFQDRENPDRHADDPFDQWLDTGADHPP
ncbi:MAG: transposase [Dehalococcoidia bacterium]